MSSQVPHYPETRRRGHPRWLSPPHRVYWAKAFLPASQEDLRCDKNKQTHTCTGLLLLFVLFFGVFVSFPFSFSFSIIYFLSLSFVVFSLPMYLGCWRVHAMLVVYMARHCAAYPVLFLLHYDVPSSTRYLCFRVL